MGVVIALRLSEVGRRQQALDDARAGAQRKAASAVEQCVEALAAKVRDDVAVVLVDVKAARLRAATHASIAARERKLKPGSLLLQRCPEASLKIWSQVESFLFAVPLPPERIAPKELIKAVERCFGKGVHVCEVHNTNRRDRDFEAFWLTRAPSMPGKKLSDLTPKDLLRVLAENGQPRPVVGLTRKELEALDRLMAKDALTFAPLLAPKMTEKGGSAYFRMLHVLNEPATSRLAKNAAYVRALRKLYQRQRISRVADALKRVGVDVSD